MKKMREVLQDAEENGRAIGHFNVANVEMLYAVVDAAREANAPVVVGFSEGERKFLGLGRMVALVQTIREETNHPIFVNADHTYSFELVKEAIDAGVDSVIFDGAELPYEENLAITKQCVEYARATNPDVLVEGELGFIGKGSEVLEKIPEGAAITEEHMTKPEEAKAFVEETGIDLFAPAVGNIHGLLKGGTNPHINAMRVKAIGGVVNVPLVLHGGSGITDDDFRAGIKAGIAHIHVATELRVAYRDALKRSMTDDSEQTTPYKIMKPVREAVQKIVEKKVELFGNMT